MKQLDLFKIMLLVALMGGAGLVNGQTFHPYSFGGTTNNYYQDYVGVRFEVVSPISVAGDKQYSYAFDGSSSWGASVAAVPPIINVPIIMPQAGDSLCGTAVTVDMTGKVAFVYRGDYYFSDKAARCYAAGAVAVVIVNNQSNGVIGMSASTPFTGCPVFMITKADGDAIDAKYHSGVAGDTARMTITMWGQGNTYDVGFINQGYSLWHDFAVPYSQMTSGIHPDAYKGHNGAFVANFGTGNPGNVSLYTATTFYPAVGAPSLIHADTTTLTGGFPAIDSIWTIYGSQFNMTGITAGDGMVTTRFALHSDSADQYLGDDSLSYSFYLTDSLYSKGRYDFVNHRPIASTFLAPQLNTTVTPPTGDWFLWGPMYYIAQGGGGFDKVQWSMASNSDTGHIISSLATISVYVFKWVDGTGGPLDSFVENGELQLVGSAPKSFAGDTDPADTSGGFFTASIVDSDGAFGFIHVDSNSWYYIAPELPNGWFLGCDGNNSSYPRVFGRANFTNYLEYPSALWSGGRVQGANPQVDMPAVALPPCTFGGSYVIDSVVFSSQKGLIPAVPFTTTSFVPDTSHLHDGVNNIKKAFNNFVLYPNPATTVVNASLGFYAPAGNVTYTILNTSAQVVSKVVHTSVSLTDSYSYNTSALPVGNYFLVVNASGKQMFKKFSVIK